MGTRIAQVANFYGGTSGGLRTTLDALGQGYRGAGCERVLVVPGASDADEDTPAGRRITLRGPRLPGSGGSYRVLTRMSAVRACLAEVTPERLEVSDKLTLASLGRWAARQSIPSVLLSHERIDAILSPRVPRAVPLPRLADRRNRRLAATFDTVVCPSAFAKAEFTRVGARNVERVPLGTDLGLFHPDARGGRPLEPDGEIRLVCVGRLSREKHPELAVDALRVLFGAGLPVRLWMVGAGPMRSALAERADGLPVEFTDHISERVGLAVLLAQADVALAPCPYETFGLAVLESLACGTPVVVARTGAARELVATGRPGSVGLEARHDPVAFAAAVAAILRWPADERRRAARARAERYPWSRTVRSMLRVHDLESLTQAA